VIDGPIPIPAALDGDRVDRALSFITGWPRAAVQLLVDAGSVLVDGREVAKSHRLHEGDVLEVLAEPPLDADIRPAPDASVPVTVRYEDDHVVVVAKPAGLVVHPGAGNATGTLLNGLHARYPEMAGIGDVMRPGIVHRLDRDTSGLLMVARTQVAFESLVAQLTARTVERVYAALVWGRMSSPRGMIDAPIGRSGARRTRMAVRDAGKPARTGYQVRESFTHPQCSLLECQLETGRTHQIRVHLSAIGHPVVGDGTYSGSRESIPLDRPFLHAGVLGFDQPVSGARLRFEEPLPAELVAVLERLAAAQPPPMP
jgi:23S rRNA pseudouridine1911/1915/1917 synthase